MGPLGNAGAANIMTDLRCRVPLPVQRDGSLDGLPLDEAPGSSGVTPKHYHELNVAEISGKALESCRLSVWCHGTKQWREGTVVGYDGSRIRHQIKFDDMTQLSLLLAACKVRVQCARSELPTCKMPEMIATVLALMALAEEAENCASASCGLTPFQLQKLALALVNKVLEASGGEEDSYIAHLQAELEETLSRHEENVGTAHAAERAEAPAKRTWGATGKRGQRRCGAAKKAKTEAAVEQGDSQAPFATGSSKKEKSSAGNREPAVDQEGSQAPLATEGRKKEQSSTGKREPVVDQEGSQAMSACGISKNKSNIGKTEATAELVDSQVPVATGGSKKKKGSKAEPKAKMEASGVVTKRGRAFSWVEQEIDLSLFSPYKLVRRKLEVYWPLERSFYPGRVSGFDKNTVKHKVNYEDGTEEELILAMERVRSVESVQAPRPLRSLSKSTSAWHSRASTSKLPPATWNDLMCLSEGIHAEAVRMLEDGEADSEVRPYTMKAQELAMRARKMAGRKELPEDEAEEDMDEVADIVMEETGEVPPTEVEEPPVSDGVGDAKEEEGGGPGEVPAKQSSEEEANREDGGNSVEKVKEQENDADTTEDPRISVASSWRRVNVGCCKPEALLGYRIKLKSIKGEGIVRGFSPQTLQHTVDFDGRKEQILLATEDVTVMINQGDELLTATNEEILAIAAAADELAKTIASQADCLTKRKQKREKEKIIGEAWIAKTAAKELREMAANAERDVDREQVQGNPSVQEKGGGIGARIVEAEELWRTRPVALWREMPLWKAAPKSLVGRRVAIYWGEDEAFYEGYVEGLCGESGPSHKVIYADGTAEHVLFAAERARMLMYPGEVLPPADAAESSAAAEALDNQLKKWRKALATLKPPVTAQQKDDVTDGHSVQDLQERLEAQRLAIACASGLEGGEVREGVEVLEVDGLTVYVAKRGCKGRWVGLAGTGGFAQGEVVIGKVKGHSWWPVMITSLEDAVNEGGCTKYLASAHAKVPARFFGTYEYGLLDSSSVKSLREGIMAGLVNRVKANALRLGLLQTLDYLQSGTLPPEMQVVNDDSMQEGDSSLTFEELAAERLLSTRRRKKASLQELPPASEVSFPFKVGQLLTVEALGRVEYRNPAYHCRTAIWPIGYRAVRLVGEEKEPHVIEILASHGFCGGEGPIFQVQPAEGEPVQGKTLAEAWQKLFPGSKTSKRFSALEMLGINNPHIVAALQSLPGAVHCSDYTWRGGLRPHPPPLTPEDVEAQLAARTARMSLPEGVSPVAAERLCQQHSCHACGMLEEYDEDFMLQCDRCRMHVHMSCYGVKEYNNGRLWLCDVCRLPGITRPPPCILCPVLGGAMKRTDCGRWCHLACARWVPEVGVFPEEEIAITNTSKINKARFSILCCLCKQQHGACIQCSYDKCCSSFHVLCAANAGFHLSTRESDVNAEGEGGALEMAAFCGRHSRHVSGPKRGLELVGWASPTAANSNKRRRGSGPGSVEDNDEVGASHDASASSTAPDPSQYVPPVSSGGSARTTPYNPVRAPACQRGGDGRGTDSREGGVKGRTGTGSVIAPQPSNLAPFQVLRRGLREPDVMEALGSKRLYVAQLPHIVTGRTGPPIQPAAALSLSLPVNPVRLQPGAAAGEPQSTGERLKALGPHVKRAVAAGKSAIHGWGAFAKLPYKQGDMVVEYIGELVRPSVANVREARLYNRIVGAGTYVFKLSESQNVDATCSGNIAHLLNHSCEPSCYSRVVTVDGCNHVVIFAKRDLEPGEELTYDYRFGSSEKLPCNCGAPRCRGYVNIDDPDLELCSGAQPWTVLRSELRPWKPPNSAVGGGGGNGDTADPQAQLDADPLVPDNAAKSLHCGASQVPSAM